MSDSEGPRTDRRLAVEGTVRRLLAGLGEAFDLDYRLPSGTLAVTIRRQLEELAAVDFPRWGEAGSMTQVASTGTDLLKFYYRPHLFPDMSPSLRLGHQLQFALLPRTLPSGSPLQVAAVLESYCHLSGDLLGWRREGEDLVLWIADISGHGIRAGLAAAVFSLLINQLPPGLPPEQLASALNDAILAARNPLDDRPLFASAVFARFSIDSRCAYASAGHPPVLVRSTAGRVTELEATGLPIGLLPDQEYERATVGLAPDETVLLYTDGVTEAVDASGVEFGQGRLRNILASAEGRPIDTARTVYDAVTEHKDAASFEDDLTFIVARQRELSP